MNFLVFLPNYFLRKSIEAALNIFNQYFSMEGWMSFVKFTISISIICCLILYYIPISRLYFRKGCYDFVDLIATNLKSALISPNEPDRMEVYDPLKIRQNSKTTKSIKNPNHRVKILYENSVNTYENSSIIPDNDNYQKTEDQIKQLNYEYQLNKKNDETKLEEKLRKLRRRIRSISSTPDQVYREKKEQEALQLIEEILKTTKKRESSRKSREIKFKEYSDSDNKKMFKVKSTISKKETHLPVLVDDLPKRNYEDLEFDDDDSFMETPMITDRVTPILTNVFHWIFGTGCQNV